MAWGSFVMTHDLFSLKVGKSVSFVEIENSGTVESPLIWLGNWCQADIYSWTFYVCLLGIQSIYIYIHIYIYTYIYIYQSSDPFLGIAEKRTVNPDAKLDRIDNRHTFRSTRTWCRQGAVAWCSDVIVVWITGWPDALFLRVCTDKRTGGFQTYLHGFGSLTCIRYWSILMEQVL